MGLLSGVADTDRRVIVLALARMVGAAGNSFLIVVLPLYIASDLIDIESLLGTAVGVGAASVTLTEPLLIGVVLSLFGFLNSFSQPLTGRLSDRMGVRRPFVLAGILLLGTASGLYMIADAYWQLIALRAAQGFGAALIIPATVALVNEYAASDADRGGNFGVYNTFRLIGFGFGPVLAGVVVERGPYDLSAIGLPVLDGFDAAFAAACAGAYLSFALVFLLVRDAAKSSEASDDLSIRVRGEGRLLDPVFALGLATVAMGICIALYATLQTQVNARLDQPPVWFGLQFAAVTIANVLFQVPVGQASDRIGRRPFLLAGFVLLAPTTLLQGIVTDPLVMTLVRLAQGSPSRACSRRRWRSRATSRGGRVRHDAVGAHDGVRLRRRGRAARVRLARRLRLRRALRGRRRARRRRTRDCRDAGRGDARRGRGRRGRGDGGLRAG